MVSHPRLDSGRIPAALVIAKQPFPKSVRQNKLIESGVSVRLLTGTLQNVWPCGAVMAEIVSDFSTKSKKNPLVVNNNVKELEDGVANFQVSITTRFSLTLFSNYSFLLERERRPFILNLKLKFNMETKKDSWNLM